MLNLTLVHNFYRKFTKFNKRDLSYDLTKVRLTYFGTIIVSGTFPSQ